MAKPATTLDPHVTDATLGLILAEQLRDMEIISSQN
jgi:hypothetical protein